MGKKNKGENRGSAPRDDAADEALEQEPGEASAPAAAPGAPNAPVVDKNTVLTGVGLFALVMVIAWDEPLTTKLAFGAIVAAAFALRTFLAKLDPGTKRQR